jgi:TolB protein
VNLNIVNVDRSGLRLLAEGGFQPTWSPDGKQIAFTCYSDENKRDICLINADGTNQIHLTKGSEDDYWPTWRP